MGRLRVLAVSVILLLGLSGCLQPTPLNIASLVADAGSYAVSGKTLVDHGVSGITSQDCAISRIFTEGAVCRENVTYEAAPKILEPMQPATDILEPLPVRHKIPADAAVSSPTQASMQPAAALQGDYVKSALPTIRTEAAASLRTVAGGRQIADRSYLRSTDLAL